MRALTRAPADSEPVTDRPAPAPEVRRVRPRLEAATMAHVASLVAGYVGLLVLLRGTWFRGDDFEFLANRMRPSPVLGLWVPHNEHWSTGPILIWRALYDAFGMSSVVPYLAVSLAAHVLAAHVLWRLMLVAGAQRWVATGLAGTFVFLGAGYENITWAFQLGFMGSLALGLAALLLLSGGGRRAFVAAVPVAIVSLAFSGMSLPFVLMAVAFLAVTARWVRAVAYAVGTGTVYLAWYLAHGRHAPAIPPHVQSPAERLANAAPWIWRSLTSALESLTSAPGVGTLLLVGLAVWLVRRVGGHLGGGGALRTTSWGLVAAFVVGLLGQLASLAVNRGDISLPDTSRYAYFVIALLLPLVALVLSEVVGAGWPRVLVTVLMAYLVVTQGLVLVTRERSLEYPQLQRDVLGLGVLLARGEPVFPTTLAVDVTDSSVRRWAGQGVLGDLSAVSGQAVADARLLSQVRLQPTPPPGAGPGGVRAAAGGPAAPAASPPAAPPPAAPAPGSCATVRSMPGVAAAAVDVSPSTTVSLIADRTGELAYQIAGPGPASRALPVALTPHQAYWLTATVPLTLQLVAAQGQELQLCPG